MARPRVAAGGGVAAITYALRKGREAGGLWRLYRRMRSRNACKTCALGMGGQRGGMVNEAGPLPGGLQEVASRRRPATCRPPIPRERSSRDIRSPSSRR